MRKILCFVLILGIVLIDFSLAQPNQKPNKPVLAVLKLKALEPITDSESYQITNFLQSELLYSREFTLIDRIQVDEILKEMKYQQSGACDVTCAAEIGKQLAASKVIKGSVGKLGNAYTISIDLVDVETARIENSSNILERCALEDLPAFMRQLVTNLLSANPTGAPRVSVKPKDDIPLSVPKPVQPGAEVRPAPFSRAELEGQLAGYKAKRTLGWILVVPSAVWTSLAVSGVISGNSGDKSQSLLLAAPGLALWVVGLAIGMSANTQIRKIEEQLNQGQLSLKIDPARSFYAVSWTYRF